MSLAIIYAPKEPRPLIASADTGMWAENLVWRNEGPSKLICAGAPAPLDGHIILAAVGNPGIANALWLHRHDLQPPELAGSWRRWLLDPFMAWITSALDAVPGAWEDRTERTIRGEIAVGYEGHVARISEDLTVDSPGTRLATIGHPAAVAAARGAIHAQETVAPDRSPREILELAMLIAAEQTDAVSAPFEFSAARGRHG